ncbi:MAG: hypothetical protein ABR577_09390 [Pyrinomonadaceae bacterium]
MKSGFNHSLDRRLAFINATPETKAQLNQQRARLAGINIPASVNAAIADALRQAVAESFVDSSRLTVFIATGLASAAAALLLIEAKENELEERSEAVKINAA